MQLTLNEWGRVTDMQQAGIVQVAQLLLPLNRPEDTWCQLKAAC